VLEPYFLGKHKVEGRFRGGRELWRGTLDAEPITFDVVESADAEQLLKAKFDRLMVLSQREYQTDPATCDWLVSTILVRARPSI